MTIETAMYFALGFLSAGILALVIMSSLWRRAVRLTTLRVEKRMPADMEAVRADRDMAAARFARDLRRLELVHADLRRREAEARIEAARTADAAAEVRDLHAAGLVREETARVTIEARDATIAEHVAARAQADERIAGLEGRVEEHLGTIAGLTQHLGDREVEVATRKTEIGALEVQIDAARERSAEQMRRIDELMTDKGRLETQLAQERDRAGRLDKRIERLIADVADREEVADRRQRELDRTREALTLANQRIGLLSQRDEAAPNQTLLRSLDRLEARNHELEARLAGGGARAAGGGDDATTREGLRDQIADLAAEVVHLTGSLEGHGSPIDRIVAAPEAGAGRRPTLADRIRALRATATPTGAGASTADRRVEV